MRATKVMAVLAAVVVLSGCSYAYRNPAEDLGPGEVGGRTVAGVEVFIDGVAVGVKGAQLDATSRANGRFAMLPLPVGRHTLMFRKGKERALQREVDVAWGKDGQPQGLWLGDVTVPAAVTIAGECETTDGSWLAENGVAVDEVSGDVVTIHGDWEYGDFAFEGLSIGQHRIRVFASDEFGDPWVGGPVEVTLLPSDAGTRKTLTRLTLHRVGDPATDTGLVRLKFSVAGARDVANLKLSDLTVTGLPPGTSFGSDGVAQVDLPEGLWTVAIKLPAGFDQVLPPRPVTFVAVKGKTLDLGTLYAVAPDATSKATRGCHTDADCAPGACGSGGICDAGYVAPVQASASLPWCDLSTSACTVGPYRGVWGWNGTAYGYGPPYTATCASYADGTATVAVACGASCTPDGLTILEGTPTMPGCLPVVPLVVTPSSAIRPGDCSAFDVITFTATGGTPPYVWPQPMQPSVDGSSATWDACDRSERDYPLQVTDSGSPPQSVVVTATVDWPPRVSSASPYWGQMAVPVTSVIQATFNEPLAPASVSDAAITVSVLGAPVIGSVTLDAPGTTLTFTPIDPLPTDAMVDVTVNTTVTDLLGISPSYPDSWYFNTVTSTKAISSFSLAGVAGTIDEAGKTVSVTLPAGTAVTALVATYTSTGVGVAVGATPQVSGTTANDFTLPVTYVVTAEDGSTASYLVTVTAPALVGNTWSPTSTLGAPAASGASVVWTGTQLIVWGGTVAALPTNTGGRYDLAADAWTPTSTTGAPTARSVAGAAWTGTELIVWGGFDGANRLNSGGRYVPATDTWSGMSTLNAPSPRFGHSMLWTGTELIVWGGNDGNSIVGNFGTTNTGARYDPATDLWTPLSTAGAPTGRFKAPAVWTGTELIVWGGDSGNGYLASGGRYVVASDTWTATATLGAPVALDQHSAVWTGTEMIVWGGEDQSYKPQGSGSRYAPATDSWAPVSLTGAPAARRTHTAVWTGTEMIVWGGWNGTAVIDSGGRYLPASDSWTSTTLTAAPSARFDHAAVWTGAVMVVWGGSDGLGVPATAGGRYTP